MTTFGNAYWNNATDNRYKSIISCDLSSYEDMNTKLETSGINYYGYILNESVRIAIDDKDLNWFKELTDTLEISVQKSSKPYSPPEKNIIGNTAYKYIPQKTYFSTDRDTLMKMAELLNKQQIKFSGRVYENGKGTLTVSANDFDSVKLVNDQVIEMRKQFVKPDFIEDERVYKIYQLKEGEEYHYARFSDYETNTSLDLRINDYELKYEDSFKHIKNRDNPLDEIFTRFNIDRPEDFAGHSLSVSDVIVIEKENDRKAFYVDSYGFKELPEFFKEKGLIVTEPEIENENKITSDKPMFEEAYADSFESESKVEENENFEQMSLFSEAPTLEVTKDENFRITDESLGNGGPKEKFRNNIEAIKTLKTIEAENRSASEKEKALLSKYVGWGGLAMAFDHTNTAWRSEYTALKEVLDETEYRSAMASTLDSFYTSPVIIENMYDALKNFGFEGGNLLEPACGVGNFIGCMPTELANDTHVYGVELDSVSGRIARKLYPDADIQIKGFEKTDFEDGSFDVVIGNVPFGENNLTYKNESYKIHDYFFMQSLDKVKEGGIVAFITSTGTLDKASEAFRSKLAEKADLLGAVRLPSGAFRANAGTDVTSDILFMQKRSAAPVQTPEWVHLAESETGLSVNSYFVDHPDMILGELVEDTNPFSSGTKVISNDLSNLKNDLADAIAKITGTISDTRTNEVYKKKSESIAEAPEELRYFSFFKADDKIFFKEPNDITEFKYNSNSSVKERAFAFIEIRDTTRALLAAQEQNQSDEVITSLQQELNRKYDAFYEKFGLLHSKVNKKYFCEDISYNLVLSLEKAYEKDKLLEKSDIFSKRTIKPAEAVSHVESAIEALALSVAEKAKVDFEYMTSLTGLLKPELLAELQGEIFQIPNSVGEYQTANEYLSGDIRRKLDAAKSALDCNPHLAENIAALEAVMPEPLKAGDIEVKIGATWIGPKLYDRFMYETFETPHQYRNDVKHSFWERNLKRIETEYCKQTGVFFIQNKTQDKSINTTKNYGTNSITAYEIMELLLNLKEPKITKLTRDPVTGDEKRVVDIEATKIAQKKADKIRDAFKEWIFKDPERRDQLVDEYNRLFNSIRPREYDGSNLRFPNMNADIRLHEHQKNAIAHALFGGNTLFAHSVGAGKTFEMIATAMESKRLGLCTKSLFVVPNHLTEQIGSDFQKLYPSANILVATKNDFKKENRQQLFAKIATGNFDAVIIGHSQLKMIPISLERQERIITNQIDDITEGIAELKQLNGSKFQIKQLERTKKSLDEQLAKLQVKKQDDTVTFEEMGIDKLFVDEAHEFKNLFTVSKLQNVSGISTTASQKALDLFMKCQYLDEKTGGKGVVFATGTPLSNSVTELHTMMRYLEYDFLSEKGLANFDNWVTVFGSQKTDWELAPAGNKFKQRTRIANYTGLPELMSMFKQIADVRTSDTLKLDVPECELHVVNVEATEFQKILVKELADRADDVQDRKVDASYDNMLRITSDGRKLGLDPRLIDPSFEDNPATKLNQCVNNVFDIYQETNVEKLTQIIFCDLGVPHKSSSEVEKTTDSDEKSVSELESFEEECDFCVYDDIKKKLVNKGIPENEIAFIHDAKTEKQKSELFEKVRNGDVRVLLGSTPKMGTGTNVQDRLIAQHDLDIPWRPADCEQRMGRAVRQGNQNKKVHIYRYVTKGTFDSYSYQTLECKQKFISQIMTSKTPVRKCEDVDQQALTYGEIKALCTGDERIKEKMQLDNEVKELRILKAEHTNTVYDMQDKVRNAPVQEERLVASIRGMHEDMDTIRALPVDAETKLPVFSITIGDTTYTDKTEAAKVLGDVTFGKLMSQMNVSVPIGKLQGFDLSVYMDSFTKTIHATLKGASAYTVEFGSSYAHNIKKLESALYRIDATIDKAENELNQLKVDMAEARKIIDMPFAYEDELKSKTERLDTLTEELNAAAMEEKMKNPNRERTAYFDRAKLKKEAMKTKMKEEKAASLDERQK